MHMKWMGANCFHQTCVRVLLKYILKIVQRFFFVCVLEVEEIWVQTSSGKSANWIGGSILDTGFCIC